MQNSHFPPPKSSRCSFVHSPLTHVRRTTIVLLARISSSFFHFFAFLVPHVRRQRKEERGGDASPPLSRIFRVRGSLRRRLAGVVRGREVIIELSGSPVVRLNNATGTSFAGGRQ